MLERTIALTLTAAGLVCLAPPSRAQGTPGGQTCTPHRTLSALAHHDVDTRPEDVAITPNGKVAIVRGNGIGAKVLAYNLTTGAQVAISGTFTALGDHLHDCDVVEVTNTRAIVTGSAAVANPTENRTYVDIFSITSNPVSVSALRSYTFTDSGEVHDVAITPDGTKAVVTSAQRIRVFDLTSPGVSPLADLAAPSTRPRWAFTDNEMQPWTDIPADSVQVTDTRAIIQYSYKDLAGDDPCGLQSVQPYVYIVDLTVATPAITLSEGLQDIFTGCQQRWPHDLHINPSGNRAVVGSLNGVAFYNLSTMTRIGQINGNGGFGIGRDGGLYQTISKFSPSNFEYGSVVDSVAISDGHVLTIADDGGINVFSYDIGNPTGGLVHELSIPFFGAHDIRILNNGSKALAHSRATAFVIDLTTSPPTFMSIPDPANCDPRGSPLAFVSDSVEFIAPVPRAVSITTNSTLGIGRVTIFNTGNGNVTATPSLLFDSADDRLADLRISDNFVIIRGSDSANDLVGYNTCTGQSMGSFDLLGNCLGVDHLELSQTRVITISENPSGSGGVFGHVDIYSF